MAAATNTLQVTPIVTLKVAMEKEIQFLDKFNFPLLSRLRKVQVRTPKPEHAEDNIPAAVTTALAYGDELSESSMAQESVKHVTTQVLAVAFKVSLEADLAQYEVNLKGNRTTNNMMKAAWQHKESIETLFVGLNQASQMSANGNNWVGKAPSFVAMAGIQHNQEVVAAADSGGNKGVSGGWGGTPAKYGARTDASEKSRRELDQDIFDAMTVALKNETDDGMGKLVMCNSFQKQKIAGFNSIVPPRNMINLPQEKVLINRNVDTVKDVHGDLYQVLFNRFARKTDVLFVNIRKACVKHMYFMRKKRLPEKGFYSFMALGSNLALEFKHDKAFAVISDLKIA